MFHGEGAGGEVLGYGAYHLFENKNSQSFLSILKNIANLAISHSSL
jgi:hypothetical protein